MPKTIVLAASLALLIAAGGGGQGADAAPADEEATSPPAPAAVPSLDLATAAVVDLTWPLGPDTLYWPTSPSRFELETLHHGPTEGGFFYSANRFCTPEHGGTHLDAPIHFGEGRHATDEIPVERLIGPGVVIDVSALAAADADHRLTVETLAAWEASHGRIPEGAIVLLRTGWSARWPDARRYLGDDTAGDASNLHFPSYGAEAARWLIEQRGAAVLGVDTASIDHGPSTDFPVHRVAAAANVPGLENLMGLEALPATGFWVVALPVKIEGGSGGPVRVVALVPAQPPAPPATAPPAADGRLYDEVAAAAGIRHRHRRPVLDPKLDAIMPWMTALGAAACTADYDRDGRLDLFATNSRKGEPNFLYRNLGPGADGVPRFAEVAAQAGVAAWNDDGGVAMDCVWGDVDNDGWPDLFLARWGRNLLLRNRGDGTFEDVTAERFRRADGTPGTDWKNSNAAIFLDFDGDGRLDIFVANYFRDQDLWDLESTRIMHDSFETSRNGGVDQLFRQQPDGTFREVAAQAGVASTGWTLAAGAGDLDGDGLPDLYLAADFGTDQLFRNRGDGTFEDVSETAIGTDTKKGMNAELGDYDNDGRLDVYVTNITTDRFVREGNMLWHNQGVGEDGRLRLTDVAAETGTFDGGWGWGAKFFDADLDGDLDLIAVNGFVSAGPDEYWPVIYDWRRSGADHEEATNWPPFGERSYSGYETLRFFRNLDLATFTEEAAAVGLASDRDQRGVVVFDVDNDGDLDIFLANQDQPPELFLHRGVPGRHWLTVELIGDPARSTARDAVGARVTVWTAAGRQIRERDGGNGFAGQSDPRLHFGLGTSRTVDRLEVRWPDGAVQVLEDVTADQHLTIRQADAPPPG
jgi:enediyne biosynthesis protein E4